MNDNLVKRGNEEYIKAINEAVADVAKSKKADIVLSKVVSIYNKEKYLHLVLRNVQNQSLRDIEIVCLDDGSTDNRVEVIEKFQKDAPRIVLYKHEKNMGLVTTRAHLGQYVFYIFT